MAGPRIGCCRLGWPAVVCEQGGLSLMDGVWLPRHCAFLLGGRIPQTPCGAGGSCMVVGDMAGPRIGCCRLGWPAVVCEQGGLSLMDGVWLPRHCAFLLGGRIPQTPCGAGGCAWRSATWRGQDWVLPPRLAGLACEQDGLGRWYDPGVPS